MNTIVITSAYRKSYWYSKYIGHVFEVDNYNKGGWIKVKVKGKHPFVRVCDCATPSRLETIVHSLRIELKTIPSTVELTGFVKGMDVEMYWDSLSKKSKKIIASAIGMSHCFVDLKYKFLFHHHKLHIIKYLTNEKYESTYEI